MKNKTKKQKGAEFEKFLVKELKNLDSKTYRVFGSGAGLDKADVRCPQLDWMIEAKNHKNLVIIEWIEQIKRQSNDANIQILAFKYPKSSDINPEPYVVLSLYDLMDIMHKNAKISLSEPVNNKELQYKLNNLKTALNAVLKELKE